MVRVGGAWRCFRIGWRLFESVRGFFDLTYVRSRLIFFCVDLLLLFSTWTEVLNGNEILWQWIDRRVRRLNILLGIVFLMLVVVFFKDQQLNGWVKGMINTNFFVLFYFWSSVRWTSICLFKIVQSLQLSAVSNRTAITCFPPYENFANAAR